MKKIFTYAILAFFLSIIVSGCGLFGGDKDGEKEFVPTTAQEQLDAETVVQAVGLKNLELCGTIASEAQKEYCTAKVSDEIILDKAVSNADEDECGDIADKLTKERCEILAAEEYKKVNFKEIVGQQQKEIEAIVEAGDIGECASIEDENFKKQCETNIYLTQARETMDEAPCENIEEKAVREICADMVLAENSVPLEEPEE